MTQVLGAADGPRRPTRFTVDVRAPIDAFPQPPSPPPGPPPRWHPAPLLPPSGVWLGLCGRIMSVGHNQNMGGVYRGICLQVNATAASGGVGWRVEKNGTEILASGELPAGGGRGRFGVAPVTNEGDRAVRVATAKAVDAASLSAWHTLELAFECGVGEPGDFTASIDGAVVMSGNTNATAGMAGLSSGWHVAEFDRFNMSCCAFCGRELG